MKYTLITGAANGLGKEFAKIYAKNNNNLILVDIDNISLLDTKNEILSIYPDSKIETIIADLSNKNDLDNIYNYTKTKNYFINNIINSAGFGDRCDFKNMDVNKQLKMTDVCCNALLYFTRVYLDDMLKNDEGHIINVSSIAGFYSGPYMSTYHAVKAYVLILGESISYELRNTNVKLLTLCPGPFNSKFVSKAHNDYTFSKIKPLEAYQVAEFGYKKSIKGKTLAVVGFKNRFTIFLSRFVPRKFIARTSAKTMKKNINE